MILLQRKAEYDPIIFQKTKQVSKSDMSNSSYVDNQSVLNLLNQWKSPSYVFVPRSDPVISFPYSIECETYTETWPSAQITNSWNSTELFFSGVGFYAVYKTFIPDTGYYSIDYKHVLGDPREVPCTVELSEVNTGIVYGTTNLSTNNGTNLGLGYSRNSTVWLTKGVHLFKLKRIGGSNAYIDSIILNKVPALAISVSSEYNSTQYGKEKVVDGIMRQSNDTGEWASKGEQNPWIQLNWAVPQTFNTVTLYDRMNLDDWAKGGTLYFSDGSNEKIPAGSIPNNGSPYTLQFPTKSILWAKFQVEGGTGPNVGLAEMKFAMTLPPTPSNVPVIYVSSEYDTTLLGKQNLIDGITGQSNTGEWASNESNPRVDYFWNSEQTINTIKLYDRPDLNNWAKGGTLYFSDRTSIQIPEGSIPNDGSVYILEFPNKTVTGVTFVVQGGIGSHIGLAEMKFYTPQNIARAGMVTLAVSSYLDSNHTVQNVIDGNRVAGDIGVWASFQQNPWVEMTWSEAPRTIDHIILYDLSDTTRNVNGGQLSFSDGSTINVTGIPKNGDQKVIYFPSKTVQWVRFTVTDGEGENNGLAEMQVFSSQ